MPKMTEADKVARYGPVVQRFNSASLPDIIYDVRYLSGVYTCNCKGWIFNRDKPKHCRHTDYLQADKSFKSEKIQTDWASLKSEKIESQRSPVWLTCEEMLLAGLEGIGMEVNARRVRSSVDHHSAVDDMLVVLQRHLDGQGYQPQAEPSDFSDAFGGTRLITLD